MSRAAFPKQLIPFLDGKSLLQLAYERCEGLIPAERRYVCAGQRHRDVILAGMPELDGTRFLGEPQGRDTLNAVGFAAAVLGATDPDAVIAVFTADHVIRPEEEFRHILNKAFDLVEREPETLVTFGITPTAPATGYGYLELGEAIDADARVVQQFREKPSREVAQRYLEEGPEHYLWNSGMFLWRAETLLDCIQRYEPTVWEGLMEIGDAWSTPNRDEVLTRVFPSLKKISVDFAVMEPASRETAVRVAAIPLALQWLDVGSWPTFAETRPRDEEGNAIGTDNVLLHETRNCLISSSEPDHLVATIGCQDLIVIHTGNATLVCSADMAEEVKKVQQMADERFDGRYT
jgi:mannose-1-phosphate guanylyltransferase